jgi:hypothetical protein
MTDLVRCEHESHHEKERAMNMLRRTYGGERIPEPQDKKSHSVFEVCRVLTLHTHVYTET